MFGVIALIYLNPVAGHWRREGGRGHAHRGHCAGAAFGGEFGNSASSKLAFTLQNGFGDFRPLSRHMSEMVQDMTKVVIDY